MRLKITFLSFFVCFKIVLFSQTNSLPLPGTPDLPANSKNSNPVIFNGDQAIATSYTRTACGLNYVYASKPLFARAGNNFTLSTPQPATFAISGLPACAVIEKAFLYIGTSGNSVAIAVSITNPGSGNSVFPATLIGSGPDKNWGFTGSYTYRADVTAIMAGNGNYVISAIPTSTANTGDDANGALLFVIYSDRSQNFSGSIVLADGNFVNANATGSVNTTITGFNVCGTPSTTTNFMLMDDLQAYGNTTIALNNAVPNYTQSSTADLPWEFLSDPGTSVTIAQSTADFGLVNTADTVGLLMVGLYFQSDCLVCPQTLALAASSTPSCLGTASVVVSGGVAPFTYTWSGTGQTTSDVTGLAAGVYTVTASDNLSCISGTTTINVLTPTPPIAVNPATVCIGYPTNLGMAAATAYTWSPAGTLNAANLQNVVATPLATTIYTIDFINALGCNGTSTVQVLVTMTQTIPVNNSTLCGLQNINLSTNGFTGDFYLWQGPGGYISVLQNPIIVNAATILSGSYNLSVSTIPGCTSTAVSSVTVFPLPNPVANNNGPLCENFNLNLTSSGGVNYTWSGPNGFINATQNPTIVNAGLLASGVYSVDVSFANGCLSTATTSVLIRPIPVPAILSNSNVCIGRPLSLTCTLSGVTFQWVGPNGFSSSQQSPSITAVTLGANGVYTLTVTDNNNCQGQDTFTLAALLNPSVTASGTTVCYGAPATLTANGLGFYQWLGPNGFNQSPTVTVVQVPQANNLSSGVYTVILISALTSCSANATTTLSTIPLPVPIGTGTDVCLNSPATLTVTGGSTYDWNGPNSYTATGIHALIPVANPLSTGIYTTLVTGANTCTALITTSLGTIPLPTVTATGTLLCLNEPFTIVAAGAFTYSWTGPSGYVSYGASAYVPIVNNLSAGLYTVFARAANSCTGITTASLSTMPLPVITTTSAVVCLNQPAILYAAGGLANTTGYKWRGPGGYISYAQNAVIPSANSAAPQIYTVVGTAPNTCTNVNTANLLTYSLPTVSATGTTICYGEPFTIVANGAATYTWSGPNSINTSGSASHFVPVVNSLSQGVYTIVGRAVTGCTNIATTNLNTMPLPIITATGTSVCFLEPATLLAGGGTAIGYSWTGPGSYASNSPNAFIPIAGSALPQTYTVVGTGPNTCTNITTAILKTFPLPLPAYNATANVCLGSYVTLQGFGAKTYTWTGPRHYFSASQNISFPTFASSQSGSYTLSVVDSLGCKNFTTASVNINAFPEGYLESDNTANYCVPFCSNFKIVKITPAPIITTNWIFYGDTVSGEIFKYCTTQAGTFKLTGVFTDALGCSNTLTFAIGTHPQPVANFVLSNDKPIENLDEVIFTNTSTGEKITNYNWFFIETDKFISGDKNTSYLFENVGQYEIAMIVQNTWGCKDTVVKSVIVESDFKLYVPDAFTPNNDGVNEVFRPKGRGILKYNFEIYNRWGDIIFHTNDFETGWDGKLLGNACENDIYAWKIDATDMQGQKHDLTGHVTLLK